jgi:hypothetical protein
MKKDTPDHGSSQPDDHVTEQSEAASTHNPAGDRSSENADDNPAQDVMTRDRNKREHHGNLSS